MEWWMWILLGLALLVLEMVTPGGFYFVFFGVGALLVGGLSSTGITETDWVEWVLFSVFSIVATALFRKPLLQRFGTNAAGREVDNLVGETATVMEGIQPGAIGKAELRGSSWNVVNTGRENLERGQRVQVERVDGLTLFVRSAGIAGSSN